MPIQASLIMTRNVLLSNLSTFLDGPLIRTTPYVSVGGLGVPAGSPAVAVLFIPAYTNRNPASGVGIYSAPLITTMLQGSGGDPTVEATWQDVGLLHSIGGVNYMRPLVPVGSTGEGTPENPIRSNRAIIRFVSKYTNYRLSIQFKGDYFDASRPLAYIGLGAHNADDELL